ncbi:hypothetical protein [Priestia megaterium]|uniref:hypothetical protein n=1 Tax=Priestia megaterium TaxID=1404 RepID=UPI0011A7AD04|nr:hypothetical protein [Priestia megaterium]
MKKVIGFALAVIILAVGTMFFCNALYGLLSLIFQRASIYQYKQFVYDYKPTIRSYCAKYLVMAVFTPNYYVQKRINRAPFIVNRLLALILVIWFWILGFTTGMIYNI